MSMLVRVWRMLNRPNAWPRVERAMGHCAYCGRFKMQVTGAGPLAICHECDTHTS